MATLVRVSPIKEIRHSNTCTVGENKWVIWKETIIAVQINKRRTTYFYMGLKNASEIGGQEVPPLCYLGLVRRRQLE
jgi:hypothetical protein